MALRLKDMAQLAHEIQRNVDGKKDAKSWDELTSEEQNEATGKVHKYLEEREMPEKKNPTAATPPSPQQKLYAAIIDAAVTL